MISVIVPSYNQGTFIRATIDSIMQQTEVEREIIVVDGGSSDSTLDVLRSFGDSVRWISEPDMGQADALNKGLRMAKGEIVGWLNSDDLYEVGTFSEVAVIFKDNAVQWVIGDVANLYDDTGLIMQRESPEITIEMLLKDSDIVRQPGTFFRRSLLERIGGWDASLQSVMDYDLWIRMARVSKPQMVHKRWAYFRIHANQKTSGKTLLKQTLEICRVQSREGTPFRNRVSLVGRKALYLLKFLLKEVLVMLGIIDRKYLLMPYQSGSI